MLLILKRRLYLIQSFKNSLLSYLLVFGILISKSQNGAHFPTLLNDKDVFGTRAFIENRGQFDKELPTHDKVYFVLDNGLEKIFFTDKGLVYQLTKALPLTEHQMEKMEKGREYGKHSEVYYVYMNWLNANTDFILEKKEQQQHYFTYGDAKYNSNAFKKITYKNIYPNIDIEYTIPADKDYGIKYSLVVNPGADPAQIKFAYSGDVSKITSDEAGNVLIKTPLWNITEHVPNSFYEDKEPVASEFNLRKNVIGFKFPSKFSHAKILIIDPWVTSITSLSTNNYGYDVDYDYTGNVYVYGGLNLFKIACYNPAGVLQWTFSGTIITPAWSSAPTITEASNFAVNKFTSKTYVGQGFVIGGSQVVRLNATGTYDNFMNLPDDLFREVWEMGFHCTSGEVLVFGGTTTSNNSAISLDPITAGTTLHTFQPTSSMSGQDVVSHAIDNAGNIFVIYAQNWNSPLSVSNKICAINSTFNGNIWTQPSTFSAFTEGLNKINYGPGLTSNGFNCLAVNANYLFYYDGFHIAAYDKTTGGLVASSFVNFLTIREQGGIAVDDCNNLYLGGIGSLLGYHFNGSAFSTLPNISLGVSSPNPNVFDIQLDKQNNILYVSGKGFVGSYSAVNSFVCPTATSNCFFGASQDYTICAGQTVTLTATNVTSLTGVNYSIQPGGISNASGIFTISPLATTVYTLFISGNNQANTAVTNSAVASVVVFVNPVVTPSFTQTSCTSTLNAFNLNLTFNPASSPAYTISWFPLPNGVTNFTQTSATGGLAPGTYSANVLTAGGCSVATLFTINPIPSPANFTISPPGGNYLVTCAQPTLVLSYNPSTLSYTSTNGILSPITGPGVIFTGTNSFGTWTVNAFNPQSHCTSTQTFFINTSTVIPTSTVSPLFQNITCSITSVSPITAYANPTVNITHSWFGSQGGTLTATTPTAQFLPGGPGTYTHCVTNDENGCSTCKTFSVFSNSGFPTYNVNSPDNFTLGCTTKSVATINIINASTAPTPGGPVSYTLIGPPTSSFVSPGILSGQSTYTVNVPGTWTVITKDNSSLCETRVQLSVLQNTFAPQISVGVPQQILTCFTPSVVLDGQSTTSNVSYLWTFPGTPGNITGNTITVSSNSIAPTVTTVANYTLIIMDNNSTCISTSVVPMSQNLFTPNGAISGGNEITCVTTSLILTNSSSSNIPPVFGPLVYPVIASLWEGPSPQSPLQVSSTYVAVIPGTYTMTAEDLNNGCISVATKTVIDFREYPDVNRPDAPKPFILDCGASDVSIYPIISNTTTSGYSYTWIAVPGATTSSTNEHILTTNTTGLYEIIVLNNLNGCTGAGFVSVIDGGLTGEFIPDPVNGTAPLNVIFTNKSTSTIDDNNIMSYWNFANGTSQVTSLVKTPATTVYNEPGKYTVTLFVQKGNCLDTVEKNIVVEIPSQLLVPNIFSPNGDDVNDVFFLKSTNLEEISIVIYDRWGHKVYSLVSTSGNIEWNGKNYSGKDADEGVYNYILTARGIDGKNFSAKGNITLVR